MIVLDASVALSRLLPSQRTARALALFARAEPFFVPAIFEAEVSNALLRAARAERFDPALIEPAIQDMSSLVIVAPEFSPARVRSLAMVESLSYFDGCYLMVALSSAAPLASRDAALLAAATRRGVPIIDAR